MRQDLKDKFLAAYPRANSRDYEAMVCEEAEAEMTNTKRLKWGRGPSEETAQKRVQMWADGASEYVIDSPNFPLSGFVASHRRACVWAVLVGREANGEALRPAPMEAE